MSRFLFVFFLCVGFSLFSKEDIIVHLKSQENLLPTYIQWSSSPTKNLDVGYLNQLKNILQFDLKHNGQMHLLSDSTERLVQCDQEKDSKQFNAETWLSLGVHCLIRFYQKDNKLSCYLYLSPTRKIQTLDPVVLTGTLSQDRHSLHRIADAIHAALFQTYGIADTRILYTLRMRQGSDPTKWISEIWECDYDGANAHQITYDETLCVTPTYIPVPPTMRPRQFLFVSYKAGQPKIYLGSADQKVSARVSFLKGNQLMPTVSPQSNRLAFISDVTGNPDLFVQDFSYEKGIIGKPRQIFRAPLAAQGSPTFSPDGKSLAFVSNKDGVPRIYLLKLSPLTQTNEPLPATLISKHSRENTSPSWSPDGTKIAYCAVTKGIRQIWIYEVATGLEWQLTEGTTHKENPTWAPNSFHLMFDSSTDSESELYLVNLHQKEPIKISQGPGEKRFPAWEPRRNLKSTE